MTFLYLYYIRSLIRIRRNSDTGCVSSHSYYCRTTNRSRIINQRQIYKRREWERDNKYRIYDFFNCRIIAPFVSHSLFLLSSCVVWGYRDTDKFPYLPFPSLHRIVDPAFRWLTVVQKLTDDDDETSRRVSFVAKIFNRKF